MVKRHKEVFCFVLFCFSNSLWKEKQILIQGRKRLGISQDSTCVVMIECHVAFSQNTLLTNPPGSKIFFLINVLFLIMPLAFPLPTDDTIMQTAMENDSSVTEFVFMGLTDQPELQLPLFFVILLNYTATVMGNLSLMILICLNAHLHTPMYFFSVQFVLH